MGIALGKGPGPLNTRIGQVVVGGCCLVAALAGCAVGPSTSNHGLPIPPARQATPRPAQPTGPAVPSHERGVGPSQPVVVRGQQPEADLPFGGNQPLEPTPGGHGTFRQPMPVSDAGSAPSTTGRTPQLAQQPRVPTTPGSWQADPLPLEGAVPGGTSPFSNLFGPPPVPGPMEGLPPPGLPADVIVDVQEAQTGRFMFGAGVNSDAGLTFQVVLDERNFDIHRFPRTLDDLIEGRALRGRGQRLRIEAIPGNRVERYLVSFTEPFLANRPISLNVSGYLFDRLYFDWDEQRLGGRLALGYLLTPDLSLSVSAQAESLKVRNPRMPGVAELQEVLGENELYAPGVTLTYDTRDVPFFPTEGQYLEMSFQQYFGSFDFPRGELDYRRYLLLTERPDGSGRHVLGNIFRLGVTGSHTPITENFFAGGFSTLRGFRFRDASPLSGGVRVGGEFMLLGSTEYIFPITADDMLRGVVFADYGTIEEKVEINREDFRVSVGAGLRITVPALGAAPLALDFAIPLAREDTDRIQNFAFWFGVGR